MGRKTIKWAGREKRRQTNKAIGGSFLKTVTELATNSDSAIKKQLGLSHAAGLVDALLNLKVGDRLDTSVLKRGLPTRAKGRITLQVYSKQQGQIPSRTCQVIDYGPGMSEAELEHNFGDYAKAKAIGQRTRSLFGRGALDVFLYHSNQKREDGVDSSAHVYSVKNGILSHCQISWGPDSKGEVDSIIETETLGPVTPSLLKKYSLPSDLTRNGSVVRVILAEGTRIPHEGNFLPSLANFYMLRLIAADPSMEVTVQRFRTEGKIEERLAYDFDLGTVILRSSDVFRHSSLGEIPIDILLARSERNLIMDPFNYERRESGLLFVDDDDAVLDLTLLPEYDKNPLLSRLYGVVRLSSIRGPLEMLLESQHPVAVLTETRDGLDTKNEIVRALFSQIEKHVRPIYEVEEKKEKKGSGNRSPELDRKLKDALRELNRFHNDETEEDGTGKPKPEPEGPLSFAVDSVRLLAGQDRRVTLFAERNLISSDLNLVEINSSNSRIRIVPESELVTKRKGSRFQSIPITLNCPLTNETAIITARAFSVEGEILEASLKVVEVIEPTQTQVPVDLEFRPGRYSGKPGVENQIVLLVNLGEFPGLPNVRFRITNREGAVSIGVERVQHLEIKVQRQWVAPGSNVARVVIPCWSTAWGSRAEVEAKAKRKDGDTAQANCKIDFREQRGPNQYEDILYEDLDGPILGQAAGKYIWVNSRPPLHKILFGESQDSFDRALETNVAAQMRVANIVSDQVIYAVATKKYFLGGEKGLSIDSHDPISAVRVFVEAKRYELDERIARAFLKDQLQ